jgi:hypothetical protein
VANYYALDDVTTMDNYQLADPFGEPYPITARYFFLSSAFNESSGYSVEYYNQTFIGPFGPDLEKDDERLKWIL